MKKVLLWPLVLFIIFVSIYAFISQGALTDFTDVSGKDLRRVNDVPDEMWFTFRFDNKTKWPQELPAGFDPDMLLEAGKDPGLGVRCLHQQGITGQGVAVAIVDGHMLTDHQEYTDRLVSYHQRLRPGVNQYHGTMATSLLAGKSIGVAPGAIIHYFEADLSKREKIPEVIREIIVYNNQLPNEEKIRVISISLGATERYQDAWEEAILEAKEDGIFVVRSDWIISGIGCPIGKDRNDPTQYEIGNFFSNINVYDPLDILVPVDYRTIANDKDKDGYIFTARGGISLGVPYLSGILALAFQVNPDLTLDDIVPMLRDSGDAFVYGGTIVNPQAFVELVIRELN